MLVGSKIYWDRYMEGLVFFLSSREKKNVRMNDLCVSQVPSLVAQVANDTQCENGLDL